MKWLVDVIVAALGGFTGGFFYRVWHNRRADRARQQPAPQPFRPQPIDDGLRPRIPQRCAKCNTFETCLQRKCPMDGQAHVMVNVPPPARPNPAAEHRIQYP